MRTVYVVTTAPGDRAHTIRALAYLAAARIVYLLAWLGHVVVLAVGAVDALAAALLGVPRLAHLGRRFARVARETWEADL